MRCAVFHEVEQQRLLVVICYGRIDDCLVELPEVIVGMWRVEIRSCSKKDQVIST